MDTTQGTLLGGSVRYAQPATGYRTGIEPVLLAASIPAAAGMRVLEAGVGAGAGLLCLVARVPGVIAAGVEVDPEMASLARRNLIDNASVPFGEIITADIGALAGLQLFEHAYANPPWHDAAATPSPNPGKRLAKQAGLATLESWIASLGALVKPAGTVTVIVPASHTGRVFTALHASGCGARTLFPLWPKQGVDAKLALIQGVKGRRGPDRVAPGLVLHEPDGTYTALARAILTNAAPLIL